MQYDQTEKGIRTNNLLDYFVLYVSYLHCLKSASQISVYFSHCLTAASFNSNHRHVLSMIQTLFLT